MSFRKKLRAGWCPPRITAEDEADARAFLAVLDESTGVVWQGERVLVHPLLHDVARRYGWERLARRASEYRAHFDAHGFEAGARGLIGYAMVVDGEATLTLEAKS